MMMMMMADDDDDDDKDKGEREGREKNMVKGKCI